MMRSKSEIETIGKKVYAEVAQEIDELSEIDQPRLASLEGKSRDEKVDILLSLISGIQSAFVAKTCEIQGYPSYIFKLIYDSNSEDDELSKVTLSIRSKLKSPYKYRRDTEVDVDKDFIKNAGKVFLDVLYDMYNIESAMDNVNELNTKVEEILSENDIPYSFKFGVVPESDAIVLSITNDEVVFNASIPDAHEIASYGIFQTGGEYEDLVREKAIEQLVESLKSVQTTVQLIKAKVALIKNVTGLSTKKRASKLIRESYHRQAKHLDRVKSGVGYFSETVQINGEDVSVFALVEKTTTKNEAGEEVVDYAVVLDPFDIKTYFKVDFDVLGAVKKQLGVA